MNEMNVRARLWQYLPGFEPYAMLMSSKLSHHVVPSSEIPRISLNHSLYDANWIPRISHFITVNFVG